MTVLLAAMEEPNTLPRALRSLTAGSSRVILSYDGTGRTTELLDAADRFGVWAVFDARSDVRGLVDLVRRALSAPASSSRHAASSLGRWHLAAGPDRSGLTSREQEVVQLLCADDPVETMRAAELLGISVHTMNVHLRNVRRKLDGHYTGNRQALRNALIEVGWLEC
ncbi:LuxR C-terminal-related transcriptional regulator [Microbacterium sp. SLBN-111]|uniref:helix-turn-helix transcriptional regulator n=1 Tax=Microbacterium sp. SLBN-111 TaxID=3377733 RepID=UPI003C7567FA